MAYERSFGRVLANVGRPMDIDRKAEFFMELARQVQIEQEDEFSDKRKYYQRCVHVKTNVHGKSLKIELEGIRKLPAFKKGDIIELIKGTTKIFTTFFELRDDYIVLSVTRRGWDIYAGLTTYNQDYAIFEMHPSQNISTYANKILACQNVSREVSLLEALVPGPPEEIIGQESEDERAHPLMVIGESTKDNIVWLNEKLSGDQRRAIVNILKAENRPQPYILFGPPGTGKTVILAELVVQIFTQSKKSRVLVCGNTNVCVELLAQRIVSYGIFKKGDIARLVAADRLIIDDADSPEVRAITVDYKIFRDLEPCARVILATCQRASAVSEQFDYVIVDEVGHCQEPEVLIPVLKLKPVVGSLVFAGDPHQLPPFSRTPKAPLLAESILSRLFNHELYKKRYLNGDLREKKYDERYITMLLVCYRSDKRVMRVNNNRFYDDDLRFSHKTPSILLDIFQTDDPLLFAPTFGCEETFSPKDTSRFNRLEAKRCVDLVRIVYNGGLKPSDVGIIAAYRSQVTHISSLFETYKLERCKVASIDEFQGEEKRIIIISTVRSSTGRTSKHWGSLGFLSQYQRFNVAVSRAREAVVVVGDPRLLEWDENWQAYIEKATPISLDYK